MEHYTYSSLIPNLGSTLSETSGAIITCIVWNPQVSCTGSFLQRDVCVVYSVM